MNGKMGKGEWRGGGRGRVKGWTKGLLEDMNWGNGEVKEEHRGGERG